MDDEILETWQSIDQWLEKNASIILEKLGGPADSQDLLFLERQIGFPIPDDLSKSLSHHDGETEEEAWLFSNWTLLSASEISDLYTRQRDKQLRSEGAVVESDNRILNVLWAPRWIPFCYDGSGGFLAVDCSPTIEGTNGQIIRTAHDDGNIWVAANLADFLKRFKASLYDGIFEMEDDELEVKSGHSNWWKGEGREDCPIKWCHPPT
ncbi:SMI1/KNR4 family protein [Stieleria varia]|uniref:SMI1 / KNR4 family protein n=1 Tax=Stieleria varia TaxID=2528005 RepID=A0A5C5ZY81_9BACT|nr:SMI1/KNR4 family protein [Stieleria varia]TWT91945.1 SMI1 / KNR4 family protein [Stieleria varia]